MMNKYPQIFAIISFLLMILVNFLANYLPINNQLTGTISDKYANLFAPAGITFVVWGVIYVSLLALIAREFFIKTTEIESLAILNKIWLLFAISSLINSAWLFLWHYERLLLTIVFMIALLMLLVAINQQITILSMKIGSGRVLLFKFAFGVYLGWICIATIANITTFLVSQGITSIFFSAEIWVILLLLIGAVLAIYLMQYYRNPFVGLVIIWAFIGIIIKRNQALEPHQMIVYAAFFAIFSIILGIIFYRNTFFNSVQV